MAGRSYNDLTQYPIFPWILSNYESPKVFNNFIFIIYKNNLIFKKDSYFINKYNLNLKFF